MDFHEVFVVENLIGFPRVADFFFVGNFEVLVFLASGFFIVGASSSFGHGNLLSGKWEVVSGKCYFLLFTVNCPLVTNHLVGKSVLE